MAASPGCTHGIESQWFPVICQGTDGRASCVTESGSALSCRGDRKVAIRPASRFPDALRLLTTRPFRALAGALLLCLAATPELVRAQAVLGVGDDALTLPAGVFRLRFLSQWTRFAERYGLDTPGRKAGALEPLGVDFNLDTLGLAQFENLAPLQAGIRSLTGMTDFTASLGKSVFRIRDNIVATPVAMEFGIASRLSLAVMVPFVTATSDVDFRVNPTGREATLGFNPTLIAPSAITANAAVLKQFDQAAAQLNQQLTACAANPAGAGCVSLNANAANARALIANSQAFASGLSTVYGGRNGSAGAPFVPLFGTAAQKAIEARIAGFRALYGTFGNSSISGTGPLAAQAPLTIGDVQRVLTDSAFGVRAQPLATTITRGVGDIDIGLKLNLFDTFGRSTAARLTPKGLNWRQSIGAVYRLGTGKLDAPDNFTDLGTGDHQNDVEMRSYTDILYGAHFWVSLVARYNMQLADTRVIRITDAPNRELAAAYRQQTVTRDLGDVIDLEISPRWVLNDYLAVAGHYYYRRKFSDRYTGTFNVSNLAGQSVMLDASTLNLETEAREHRFGGGISYSTLAAYEKGKARLPLEVTLFHYETTAGSGGNTPKLATDQVQLRFYTRLFGH